MASALDVAKYFLNRADESDELLSHLKLQKLLYYSQGFKLAIVGPTLFDEEILAWEHGPVVREVWNEYRDHGGGGIPAPGEVVVFEPTDQEVMDEVWTVFGQFSAWRLREMTHDTPPWANAQRNAVIPLEGMRDYFRTQVTEA